MIKNYPNNSYDYIFTGAGCAGLSLLMQLIRSGKFHDKKILLIDKGPKTTNDRTWCFWEHEPGLFEPIVHKRWNAAWYHTERFSRLLDLSPFQYKMIRGIDFYKYCFDVISKQSNIDVLYSPIEYVDHITNSVVAGERFHALYIFNSIPLKVNSPAPSFDSAMPAIASMKYGRIKKNYHYLYQHFKGWTIETQEPCFDPSQATLMDFRVSQQHGTTFVYVLPLSPNKAMVEYTLFTSQLLQPYQYDEGLQEYINRFIPAEFSIVEEETGVIPMTDYRFRYNVNHVFNLGSAGGQTKPSSGYTFYFIQQHSKAICQALIEKGNPYIRPMYPGRFRYYDSVLLNVLATGKLTGKKVFDALFRKNKPADVLRFLNNESQFGTDLTIISSLPTGPFLRAGLQQAIKG